ncbi:hypothetical protein [Rhodococcus sp. NPDC004095]
MGDGQLEFDEETVRAVAAALMDSVAELMRLAERVDATVTHDHGRLASVVRAWAQRTGADAARLSLIADRYAEQDGAAASSVRRSGS